MSYRDDRDADRARVEALEQELAAANRKIAELEGRQETALVRADPTALATGRPSRGARIFGGPLNLELARDFDRALSHEALEKLVGVIRTLRKEQGVAELLTRSLRWTALPQGGRARGALSIEIDVDDGRTRLVVRERLHQLAGGTYGGVCGGIGGGGISLPLLLTFAHPMLGPVLFLGWFGIAFTAARTLYAHGTKRRARELQVLFDRLVEAIDSGLAAAPLAPGDERAR